MHLQEILLILILMQCRSPLFTRTLGIMQCLLFLVLFFTCGLYSVCLCVCVLVGAQWDDARDVRVSTCEMQSSPECINESGQQVLLHVPKTQSSAHKDSYTIPNTYTHIHIHFQIHIFQTYAQIYSIVFYILMLI